VITLSVAQLYRRKQQALHLELLTPAASMAREIDSPTLTSPGLVLAGFTDRFLQGRLQVLGETEIRYLFSLDEARQEDVISAFLQLHMPALFVTKQLDVPAALLRLATEHGVPVLRSDLKTAEFYRRLQPYLTAHFAPTTNVHGSLADVYGVGLLFMGRSGIGKSECVLDLVERGHRLVADDVVIIRRSGNDVLLGRGHELQQHHMEIRGVGLVDIRRVFGIRAIRQQKRVEVVVQLVDWEDSVAYDRTGLDREELDILGVMLPKVVIPLNAGKNITVISEVVAMNHLLLYAGVNVPREFNERLQRSMMTPPAEDYLEEDYE
jgi:HPr kinase/phosphorylase